VPSTADPTVVATPVVSQRRAASGSAKGRSSSGKKKKLQVHEDDDDEASPPPAAASAGRNPDKSLASVTKKFLDMYLPGGVTDLGLDDVAAQLGE